jgi:hypothetical protein
MAGLVDMLTQTLTDHDALEPVTTQLGIGQPQASQAVTAAVPLLVGALARNAATPEGNRSLSQALERDHDGSILEDLRGALSRFESLPGNGILNHVLGPERPTVERGLANATGLAPGQSSKLLEMLAPVVMGVLGRMHRQTGQGEAGLGSILGRAKEEAANKVGPLLSLLDRNHDGHVVYDVSRMATSLFRHD